MEPIHLWRRRGIAFGRGRHPASVRSLNYWRHLVAYLAIAGSLAYATDDWDLDRGDPAAHNALLRLGKREEAWRNQYIHTVANEIVSEAIEHDCHVIAFEDLTDIRERLPHAKWHHVWAFRRLFEYVSYKAPEKGVSVEQVEPNHTSQRCSRTDCGFTDDDNRHGEQFCCQKCGYEVNADYNAAKNIGLRYARKRTHSLRSSPTSGSGDPAVDVRVTGGTLNGKSHWQIAGSPHQSAPSRTEARMG